jgi:serine/threonine protein kinase
MSQDPDTSNYMIVMLKMPFGSLRDNLLASKYNPNDKFHLLSGILVQLEAIHKLNLIHGDFHNGNILCNGCRTINISDLGLCRPADQPNAKDEIYGVLPYMAPEILRGKPYTKAADIYSFGIIMWEMTSGVPAYHNIPHDVNLSLNICKGKRPEIIEGTIPEYIELMKRCWDNDPEKRPTAKVLNQIFSKWIIKYPMEKNEEKRMAVPGNHIYVFVNIYFL